jgi:hypothetical protein
MNNQNLKVMRIVIFLLFNFYTLSGCSTFQSQSNNTGSILGRWVGKYPLITSESNLIYEPNYIQIDEKNIYTYIRTNILESGIEDYEYQSLGDNRYILIGRTRETWTITLVDNILRVEEGSGQNRKIISLDRLIEPDWISISKLTFITSVILNGLLFIFLVIILIRGGLNRIFVSLNNKEKTLMRVKHKIFYLIFLGTVLFIVGYSLDQNIYKYLLDSFILSPWRFLIIISVFLFLLFLYLVIILIFRKLFHDRTFLFFTVGLVLIFTIPYIFLYLPGLFYPHLLV